MGQWAASRQPLIAITARSSPTDTHHQILNSAQCAAQDNKRYEFWLHKGSQTLTILIQFYESKFLMNLYGSHTNVVNKCLRDSGDLAPEVHFVVIHYVITLALFCTSYSMCQKLNVFVRNWMFLSEIECFCQKLNDILMFVRNWMFLSEIECFCQRLNVFVFCIETKTFNFWQRPSIPFKRQLRVCCTTL